MAGSGKSVTCPGKASVAQAQIVLEARAVLKKERDDDCGVGLGESWGECADKEEATRRAPPWRRSLLTKRRPPPRRHCRRINCRDGRWTCGSADAPQGLDFGGKRVRYMYV